MKKTGVIYKIENLVNGKVYVGQTTQSAKRRFHCHRSRFNRKEHSNPYFQSAWDKYGEENFKLSIIEKCPIDDLDDREIYWINYYREKTGVYNLESGGNKRKRVSEKTKITLSKSTKNLWKDKDFYEKQLKNNMKQVICINTGKVYESITDAAKDLGVSTSSIKMACEGKRKSVGGTKGDPMQVAYYQEGKKYKLKKLRNINKPKKVICINTKEVFNSINKAAEAYRKYGCHQSKISMCCNRKREHHGRLPNGEYLIWRFLDDYDSDENFDFTKDYRKPGHKTKVRCITTGEVFETLKAACEKYSISKSTMWRLCTGRIENYETKNGIKLRFEYA